MMQRSVSRKRSPQKTSSQSNSLKMDLAIDDFGPIQSANIKLKPLTIFLGPTNSGKSYAALLTHVALRMDYALSGPRLIDYDDPTLKKHFNKFSKLLHSHTKSFSLPDLFVDQFIKSLFKHVIFTHMTSKLPRLFDAKLEQFIRSGKMSFTLKLKTNNFSVNLRYSKKKLTISKLTTPKIKIKINRSSYNHSLFDSTGNTITIYLRRFHILQHIGKKFNDDFLLMFALSIYFRSLVTKSTYFPASRTGLLLTHKTIAASSLQLDPNTESFVDTSSLSKLTKDFITDIISYSASQPSSLFEDEINYLEKKLLGGNIKLVTKSHLLSDIRYIRGNLDISLNNASSTVSELAPIILYLRYKARDGNSLIIEEPEAHLHPAHQALLAEFLVRLIRKGFNVLFTTHSSYIIERINHFLIVSSNKQQKNKKLKLNEHGYLNSDEVGIYAFEQSSFNTTKIKNVKITKDGMDHDEYISIYNSLYDERVAIDDCIRGG